MDRNGKCPKLNKKNKKKVCRNVCLENEVTAEETQEKTHL